MGGAAGGLFVTRGQKPTTFFAGFENKLRTSHHYTLETSEQLSSRHRRAHHA